MIQFTIPGFKNENITIKHVVMDFNGTLAIDGVLIAGVKDKLIALAQKVELHVVTGNSYHTAEIELKGIPCKVMTLPRDGQQLAKKDYVLELGEDEVFCIGNGRNDKLMLELAEIGVILVQNEGASVEALVAADLVCHDIFDALTLLEDPRQLTSVLRA